MPFIFFEKKRQQQKKGQSITCLLNSDFCLMKGGGSESSSGDGPSFVVEHLATFTVSAQNAVVYPADGMRRLLQMEKASGIWTQKMMLRLDRAWVTILDYENGEVVERFPLNLIHEPTAFTSKDPKDLYNNIFIFVVGEDPVHRDPPEMHIFQCVGVSSELVVEDLKMYMAGNYRPGAGSAAAAAAAAATRIPPPPNKPPPEPPMNGVSIHLNRNDIHSSNPFSFRLLPPDRKTAPQRCGRSVFFFFSISVSDALDPHCRLQFYDAIIFKQRNLLRKSLWMECDRRIMADSCGWLTRMPLRRRVNITRRT